MNLRAATLADVTAIVEYFLKVKRATPYATTTHNVEDMRKTVRQCISSPTKYLGLIEADGVIYAALLGTVEWFWWGRHKYATDYAFWSLCPRGGELLVKDFCGWAWKQPHVLEVLLGQSSGVQIEATHALFTSLGFEHTGGIFRLSRYDAMEAAA